MYVEHNEDVKMKNERERERERERVCVCESDYAHIVAPYSGHVLTHEMSSSDTLSLSVSCFLVILTS